MGLFLILPGSRAVRAQEGEWPWIFRGSNFQITKNLGDDFSAAIASGHDLYLAVWYRASASGFDIYGARITRDGEVLDGDGIPICTAPNDQMFPSVAWDGDNFFVVWQDRRNGKRWEIYGAWIAVNGKVFPEEGIPIATGKFDQISPAVSFDGINLLTVWQGKKNSKIWNIYFSLVSKYGEVTPATAVSSSSKDQAAPYAGFNGKAFFVVWQDFRSGKFWDIYGARLNRAGEILDHEEIPISTMQENSKGWDKWRPVHGWDGGFFLVIWMASQEGKWYLEGRRVAGDGKVVDLLDIQIETDSTNKTFPALLWDGKEYLLLWEEEPEGQSKIYGASILAQYKPFAVSEAVEVSSADSTSPSVPGIAMIGEEFLIVWHGLGSGGYWQVYGQRIGKESNPWIKITE